MRPETAAPFWSVVIPLYNKQDFIAATVGSVLQQAGEDDFEVLVIDDGSRDAGAARVAILADPRVRLIRQTNSGVSAARNRGIRESRGTWIAFLDADDLWHPQALASYRKLISTFPDAEAVAGSYVRVPSSRVAAFKFHPNPLQAIQRRIHNLPADFLRIGLQYCTDTMAVRRTLFSRIEIWFPEGESMGEDLDLWFRIAEQAGFAHSSDIVALYRTALDDSLMGQYQELTLLPVWQRLRQRALSGDMPEGLRSSSLRLAAEMEVTLARRLAKSGNRPEAWRHLAAAGAAARGHRWWVTLLALGSGSARLLKKLR